MKFWRFGLALGCIGGIGCATHPILQTPSAPQSDAQRLAALEADTERILNHLRPQNNASNVLALASPHSLPDDLRALWARNIEDDHLRWLQKVRPPFDEKDPLHHRALNHLFGFWIHQRLRQETRALREQQEALWSAASSGATPHENRRALRHRFLHQETSDHRDPNREELLRSLRTLASDLFQRQQEQRAVERTLAQHLDLGAKGLWQALDQVPAEETLRRARQLLRSTEALYHGALSTVRSERIQQAPSGAPQTPWNPRSALALLFEPSPGKQREGFPEKILSYLRASPGLRSLGGEKDVPASAAVSQRLRRIGQRAALHGNQEPRFALAHLGDPAIPMSFGVLFADLVERQEETTLAALRSMARWRFLAALALFEFDAHRRRSLDRWERWATLVGGAVGLDKRDPSLKLLLLWAPQQPQLHLRSALAARDLADHLGQKHGQQWWKDNKARVRLMRLWASGRSLRLQELLATLGPQNRERPIGARLGKTLLGSLGVGESSPP